MNISYEERDGGEAIRIRYKVHRFDIKMSKDQIEFEQFLNNLEGEVVTVIPNVSSSWSFGGMGARVYYFWVIEKLNQL